MKALIRGHDQFEAICRQLWASAAYIFPIDSFSHGSADGHCYYHHNNQPNNHLVFGSWSNGSYIDPTNNGPSCPASGNPINPAVGNKHQVETDYIGEGAFPLEFRRTYNAGAMIHNSHVGANWRSSYDRLVVVFQSGGLVSGLSPAAVHRPDGRILYFTYSGGQFIPTADISDRLTRQINGSGQTTGFKYTTAAEDEVETYNAAGKLTSIAKRSGLALTLTYNTQGRLASIADSFGHQLTFTSDSSGRISTMTSPAGGVYQYTYGANNNLIAVTYPGSVQRTYHYNEPSNTNGASLPNALTGITDEAGIRFATFKYDANGYAISTEHAGSSGQASLSYSASTTDETDALGTVRTYGFQTIFGRARNTSQSQPAAPGCGPAASSTAHDVNGNVASRIDFNGNLTQYSYDLTRNLVSARTEASGTLLARSILTSWHATYRLPTLITEPNRTTSFTHDGSGNVLSRTITDTATSQSRTWTYTYNTSGRVLSEDGPRTDVMDVTTFTYYTCTTGAECGQVHTLTNALAQTTIFNTYNAHGQPLTITDANGVVTTLTYDLRQRLTSRTVGTETTGFEYWPTGLMKKTTLPDGSFAFYTYDNAHRLIEIEDGVGNRIEYTLDAMGNRTAENVYDPSSTLARTRIRVFNNLNQLWKQIASAGTSAVTTTFGYDNNGNQTSTIAPLSRNSSQLYDELDRLKQITDPGTGVTQFAYDANDNLTSVTDPKGLITSYTYNGFGDLTQQLSPDTGTTVNTYDSAGNLSTTTDARSKLGTYTYDALNRVTSIAWPDRTLAFTYDSGTNGVARLTGASDSSHSLAWSYDAQGRVIGKGQTVGSVTQSVGYGYTNGNLTSLMTPSGQTLTYGYANGRISSIRLNGSTTILSNVLYEPFGPVAGWTWGNSTLAVRVYDLDGNPTDIDSAGAYTYAYDDALRITGITDLADSSRTWSYGYDLLDRLNAASRPSETIGYTYDANGNRLTQTGTTAASYTVSPTSNRVTSITGTPARTYGYDLSGNVTSYGGLSFTYTDAGRMSSVTSGSVTTTYLMNALGQRVRKSNDTATVHFVYDESGHLLGEYDATGALLQETIWMGDTPVATLRPNGSGVDVYYVHTDHLNTSRRISRPSDNAILWRWDSDPFGSAAANEDPDGDTAAFPFNLRFPGQYLDVESGLSYNYYRDGYDPAVGRYIQGDPLLQVNRFLTDTHAFVVPALLHTPAWLHPYSYVVNSPAMETDSLGLGPLSLISCWWETRKVSAAITQCKSECPTDTEGMLRFMQRYEAAFVDDAVFKCACTKVEPDVCANWLKSCGKVALGPPVRPRR